MATKTKDGSVRAPLSGDGKVAIGKGPQTVEVVQLARSGIIAEGGLTTARDFAAFMGALISDIIAGRVTPLVANAAVNAGGKLLKMVELQQKFGKSTKERGKELLLM